MLFGLHFDFRNPVFAGTPMADRYAAALEMAAWADPLGAVLISVSEHHGSPDGYIPSPLPMVAAMAARTSEVKFLVAALIAPFYEPLRLAEDLVVLDNLSRGRIDLVVAGGYVHEEFDMYGVARSDRPGRVNEVITTLRAAFSGESFQFRGRIVQITPAPYRPGGPAIMLGGSSKAAAERAARIADGFVPSDPEVWPYYQAEVIRLGRPDPGPCMVGSTVTVALAEDPEKGWEQMAPFFMHEMNAYGAWQAQEGIPSPYRTVRDLDELRESGNYRVITPAQMVEEQNNSPLTFAMFRPMCGGMPIDLAWSSLCLLEQKVLPFV
jgi:alkanesulfonate monooxygenase SsuD/methylene tetrahydromethanopterin reductase-like flavin-dependent oxidoreductase (luciferase family)